MSLVFQHSPADILQALLVANGKTSEPGDGEAWPNYVSAEPAAPDNCVTIYDTPGRSSGRAQFDGEVFEAHGFQVRVRATDHATGWRKANEIRQYLAESVYLENVALTIGTTHYHYLIWSVSGLGNVLVLGKEPTSARKLFTINAVASIRRTA